MDTKQNKLILAKAVQLLAQRDHSIHELSQKLYLFFSRKKSNESTNDIDSSPELKKHIQLVIQYCLSNKWLNDAEYIAKYIHMRARKGSGKYKITMELKQRGLDDELIQSILSTEEIDWNQIAADQIEKKFKQVNKNDIKQKQKIIQFLQSRGFSQNEIKTAYYASCNHEE